MFKTSAKFLKKHIGLFRQARRGRQVGNPQVAILLGSGLSEAVPSLKNVFSIPYTKIPAFPSSSVEGHKGEISFGTLGKVSVMVFRGRFHLYEGLSPLTVSAPVWVAHRLGAKYFVQVSAAGGISAPFTSGKIMMVKDHLNFSFEDPLFEIPSKQRKPAFLDIRALYNKELQRICKTASRKTRVPIKSGTIAMTHGPCYETPAEVKMLKRLVADAVCMSGIPEAIIAHYLGLKILWLAVITNRAGQKTSHKSVVSAAEKAVPSVSKLLAEVIGKL